MALVVGLLGAVLMTPSLVRAAQDVLDVRGWGDDQRVVEVTDFVECQLLAAPIFTEPHQPRSRSPARVQRHKFHYHIMKEFARHYYRRRSSPQQVIEPIIRPVGVRSSREAVFPEYCQITEQPLIRLVRRVRTHRGVSGMRRVSDTGMTRCSIAQQSQPFAGCRTSAEQDSDGASLDWAAHKSVRIR